jgi:hypothetical protein
MTFTDLRSATHAMKEFARLEDLSQGREWSPEEEERHEALRARRENEMRERIRAKGFPSSLRALMTAPGKAAKVRVARGLFITGESFHRLVFNCDLRGYSHRIKVVEHTPEHLKPTPEEFEAMYQSQTETPASRRFLRALKPRLEERRCWTVHLLEKGDEWHCFYFSYDDALRGEQHWKGGKHVHYLAHDFGLQMSKEEVWDAFDERQVSLSALHIPCDLTSTSELDPGP